MFETVMVGLLVALCAKHGNAHAELWAAGAQALRAVASSGAAAMNASEGMPVGEKSAVWARVCGGLGAVLLPRDDHVLLQV